MSVFSSGTGDGAVAMRGKCDTFTNNYYLQTFEIETNRILFSKISNFLPG